MKLLATTIALAIGLTATAEANPACARDHPKAHAVIQRFCNTDNLVVPSWYSVSGKSGPALVHVAIQGGCSPAQWVPKKYCLSQFEDMCARGETSRRFGNNGCQTWTIRYAAKKASGPQVLTVNF